ncbi:MAG TPA: hypothetical protein VGJ36_06685, partial [Gemmatimonadales bacterium]
LPPFFGLISALLLARLARRLSPMPADAVDRALPFLSGALWVTYSTVVLFDTLLTACVLLALGGVVEAWRGRPRRGWLAYAAGVGLGLLAKGPVVLVHVLPVALLAPWWATDSPPAGWRRWYLGSMAAVVLGAGLGLAWALAAAAREGPAYRTAILWEQTAGRMGHAFAHQRPWWWYVPLLPVILFPWTLWPPLWRSLARVVRAPVEVSTRFALAWVVPGWIILSLISGKQVHYLMPLLPGFAILAAVAYPRIDPTAHRWDTAATAGCLILAGLLLLFSPGIHRILTLPGWATAISFQWGLVFLLGGLLLGLAKGGREQVVALSLVSPALLILAHLAGRGVAARAYDLRPVAHFLEAAETAGRPIAYVGRYSGQFHFLGRLERPFDQITPPQVARWTADHPSGLVVRDQRSPAAAAGAILSRPYRDGVIGIWEASGTRIDR